MTALAEGSDRIAARWAIGKGIHIGPVLPIGKEEYISKFRGIGYSDDEGSSAVDKSMKEFEELLSNELAYSPVIVSGNRTNRVRAFSELGAYLVSNSHLLVGIWDGRTYDSKGGTYDTIRMAYEGVDHELIQSMPSTSVAFDEFDLELTANLNAGEDTLIYWIETERSASEEEKKKKNCKTMDRKPVQSCGYFFRQDYQIATKTNTITDKIQSAIEPLDVLSKVLVGDTEMSAIESGPVFNGISERYNCIPDVFIQSFDRISELNTELDDYAEKHDAAESDYEGLIATDRADSDESVVSSKAMADMADRFSAVYDISSEYKRRSVRDKITLSVVQAFVTISFSLMILFAGSLIMTVVYTGLYIFLNVIMWQYKNVKIHAKYIEYRSLSESLRVQFYWGILGINDTVTMNCYGFLKNGMSWMRAVLKGCCSAFTNDYFSTSSIGFDDRVAFAKKNWIEEKIDYLKNDGENNIKRSDRMSAVVEAMSIVGIALAVALTVVSVFLAHNSISWFDSEAYWFGNRLLFPDVSIGPTFVIKISMIACAALVGFFSAWKMAKFADTAPQSQAKCLMYTLALSRLDSLKETKGINEIRLWEKELEVLHEIGVQEINQNNDWVFEFIGKDIQKNKAGMNMKNDSQGSGEGPGGSE